MKPSVVIENFDEKELKCRCGCDRFNYENHFLIRLQAFRYSYNKPLTVTSGCRCVKHNKSVGGVSTSLHQAETKKAAAVDVTCSNCLDLFTKACNSGLFNEVIYYRNKNFVHLGWDKNQKGNYYKSI